MNNISIIIGLCVIFIGFSRHVTEVNAYETTSDTRNY
ncbi:hypothetical protein PEC301619_21820 [Pectobacterium carotovorum subsp. carotovorum]|nr:hypothetical protein PEC301619_21820 [Pectobacterium carotovorum subsp. carotovorum]GKW36555.1 hypothetical protein PEC301875_05790 [Pectobacterium carotovorum subsp. carotovorum]